MQPGSIIYSGQTKNGRSLTIRYLAADDAPMMCDFINALSQEKTFITYQGENISLEEEITYVKTQVQKIKDGKSVQPLAICDNKLAGISSIGIKDRVEKHVGNLGISVAKDYRDVGIGSVLMTQVLQEAKSNLKDLLIVTLSVFGNNNLALNMYQKFGFKEYGRLPKGIQHNGVFVDDVLMYKDLS